MLDLDGVVYRGDEPIPAAADHLARARRHGMTLAFVTNNASRTPAAVAKTLRAMGVEAAPASVVTSAQAVARLIAERLPDGGRVLMVGGDGLEGALREHGLVPVCSADDAPDAVVQGFSPELGWRDLVEACVAVGRGVPWFASNTDRTIPTARGIAPGNGTFVDAVRAVVGGEPVVAGKPEPALFAETALRVGAGRALVVGDRLDTDIAGARRFGADSLLVLTGVTDLRAVAAAPSPLRPSFLGWDLASLCSAQLRPERNAAGAALNGWAATLDAEGVVALTGAGARDDALRLVVALAWQHLDATGAPADVAALDARLGAAESGG
jgi:HAD superfamily hydrolase (TIGR01450 family)